MRPLALLSLLLLAAPASAATDVFGVISADTTWTAANGPYNFKGDVTVNAGVTLTVEAGAVVSAPGGDSMASGTDTTHVELIVNGTLNATGTAAAPITFTSASASNPWVGIRVLTGGAATLSNAVVSNAFVGLDARSNVAVGNVRFEANSTGMAVSAGTATLSNDTFKSNSTGLQVSGGTANVTGSLFTGQDSYGVYASSAGTVTLNHCTLAENPSYGVYQNGGSTNVSVTNSVLARNTSGNWYRSAGATSLTYSLAWQANGGSGLSGVAGGTGTFYANPLYVGGGNFALTANSPARNAGSDGFDLGAVPYSNAPTSGLQGTLFTDTTLSGTNTLTGDLTVPAGKTLTLAAGTTLKFASTDGMGSGSVATQTELIVLGTLVVQGSAAQPVTFDEATAGGRWFGVRVLTGGSANLASAVVQHAAIGVSSAGTLTVTDSRFEANDSGLFVSAGTATLTNDTFKGNDVGLQAAGGTTNVTGSVFTGQGSYGVYASSAGTVTLAHCTLAENPSYGIYQNGGSTNVSVVNSLLARNTSGNWYRSAGGTALTYSLAWQANGASGLSGVAGGTGSFYANPLYVGSGNFALTANSPARNAGSDMLDLGAVPYAGAPTTGLQGTLFSDTTLTGGNTVVGDLTIPAGKTLTLAAGATLKFTAADGMASGATNSQTELIILGTLVVEGTAAAPVTLDEATAGGGWYGVRVQSGGTANVAGAVVQKASVGITSAGSLSVSGSRFEANASGVYVSAGTATLTADTFKGNDLGLQVAGGTANVTDGVFTGQGSYGVYASSAGTVTLTHCTLAENPSYGIYQNGGSTNVSVVNSVLARNTSGNWYRSAGGTSLTYSLAWQANGASGLSGVAAGTGSFYANPLYVGGGNFALTRNSPARNVGSDLKDLGAAPYAGAPTSGLLGTLWTDTVISGAATATGDLTVASGVTLTLAPGATLSFTGTDGMAAGSTTSQAELIVSGVVAAVGTSAQPITFTEATPAAGWFGVRVLAGGRLNADYTVLTKAATAVSTAGTTTVTNSRISGNGTGVLVTAGTPTLAYLDFDGNDVGLQVSGGTTNLSWSLFHAQGSYGIYASSSGAVVADHNTLADNASYGIYQNGGSTNVALTNSIAVRNPSANWYRSAGATSANYNDFWQTSGATGLSGVSGSNTITTNPLFAGATDYHLTASSPCRGVGAQSSDLGAFPFSVGPVATITISPANPQVTVGSTFTFTAQAFDAANNPIPGVTFSWSAAAAAGTINGGGQLTASCTPSAAAIPNAVTVSASGKSTTTSVTLVKGAISSVALNPKTITVPAGGTQVFTAVAKDSCQNVIPTPFTWTAGLNSGSVNQSGNYTAPCVMGTYVGAVQVSVGALTDSATVNVGSGALAQLSLSPKNPTLPAGGQQQFSVTGTDTCGNGVASPTVTWTANAAGSISSAGLFTAGTAAGTFTNAVSATSGAVTTATDVTVVGGQVASVTVTPTPVTLDRGATQTFTAVAKDAQGNMVAGTPVWTLADANAGALDASGKLIASSKAGTYTNAVVATIGGIQGKATVVIRPGPVATVAVTPASATLAPLGTTTFSAQPLDSSGNLRAGDVVVWSVTSGAAGTITQAGVFTAGTTPGSYPGAVEASVGAVKGTASITLNPTALSQLVLTPASTTVRANGTVQFQAQGKDGTGATVPVTVTWAVVKGGGTINPSGLFSASTTPGTFVDTVQATAPGGLSATATVIVQPGPVVLVELTPSHPELAKGATQQFTATAKDAFGNAVSGLDTTWTALAAAGTINAAGLFTAGTTPGDFADAIAAEVNGVKGTASVRVGDGTSTGDGGTTVTDGGTTGEPDGGNVIAGPKSGCGCNDVSGLAPGAALLTLALALARRKRRR